MTHQKTILGLIPARGGSKGVPRKNIRIVLGKPLIAWTIEAAKTCPLLNRVIVSTDDEEIAHVSREFGADVPFVRPRELAQDSTPDLPVCRHALQWLAEHDGFSPDIVVWLRPTAPLRTSYDIEDAINLLCESNVDCVRSICVAEHHPYWMYRLENDILIPLMEDVTVPANRQTLPEVYRLNGAVDVIRTESIPESGHLFSGSICGFVMPIERSIDIDQEIDLLISELLLKGIMNQ